MGSLLGQANVNFVPLQKDWVRKLFGLTQKNLVEEIKLLKVDRSKLGRADAVLHLAGKVFCLKEIVTILKLRWFRGWVYKIYSWVATRKYCMEGGCELPDLRKERVLYV